MNIFVILILLILSSVVTFVYFKYDMNQDVSKKKQITNIVVIFIISGIFLGIPFTGQLQASRLNSFTFIYNYLFLWIIYLLPKSIFRYKSKTIKTKMFMAIKIIYIVLYLPVIIAIMYSDYAAWKLILVILSIVLVLLFLVYLGEKTYLKTKNKNRLINLYVLSIFIVFIVYSISMISGPISKWRSERDGSDPKTIFARIMEFNQDFQSENMGHGILDYSSTYIIDSIIFDEKLFVSILDRETDITQIHITVYDLNSMVVDETYDLNAVDAFDRGAFLSSDNELYYIRGNGIYIWNQVGFVKISNLSTDNSRLFRLSDNQVGAITETWEDQLDIYEINGDTLSLIETFDSPNIRYSIENHELFIVDFEDETIVNYKTKHIYNVDDLAERSYLILCYNNGTLYLRDYNDELVVTIDENNNRYEINLSDKLYSLIAYKDLLIDISSPYRNEDYYHYLYDESLNKEKSFLPIYNRIELSVSGYSYTILEQDNKLYYFVIDSDGDSTYFEYNLLEERTSSGITNVLGTINSQSLISVVLILILPWTFKRMLDDEEEKEVNE